MARDSSAMPPDGRQRAVIENVTPVVDGGRFPVKRLVGDVVAVAADVFSDGHDEVRAALAWRGPADAEWHQTDMTLLEPLGNDRWGASFKVDTVGRYEFAVHAWVDHYATWQHDLEKRIAAGQDVTVDRQIGELILARNPDEVAQLKTVSDSYAITVDRERAGFSAWYELFPRSASPDPKRHGTLRDVMARLDYVSGLGFNVLYLPPVHPIGR